MTNCLENGLEAKYIIKPRVEVMEKYLSACLKTLPEVSFRGERRRGISCPSWKEPDSLLAALIQNDTPARPRFADMT
jgi:hypothetical protein